MTNKLTYHLLPTEDASEIFLHTGGDLCFNKTGKREKTEFVSPKHLCLVSDASIKEGDWFIANGKYIYKADTSNANMKEYLSRITPTIDKKIEFTTDPKLIADGVEKIDGNTKAKIVTEFSSSYIEEVEVNFLTEFCNHYNQKGDQKVDVEKLIFDLLNKHLPKDTKWTIEVERGVQNAIKEALQSNAGGFSLPTAIELRNSNILMLPLGECEIIIEAIKSLTSQPKGEMVIECDTETKTLIFK